MQLPYHDRYAYSPIIDRPNYSWPDGKRLAVYLGLNIEHFAFGAGEGHLLTVPGVGPDARTFAWRDYGNRVGVWRCLELFDELNLPAAHLINTTVFDYAPRIVDALKARGDEFIGHGRTNAERQSQMWESDEKRFLQSRCHRAGVRNATERLDGPMDGRDASNARPVEGGRVRFPDGLAGRRSAALDEDALWSNHERAVPARDQR
jgi:allantoinase